MRKRSRLGVRTAVLCAIAVTVALGATASARPATRPAPAKTLDRHSASTAAPDRTATSDSVAASPSDLASLLPSYDPVNDLVALEPLTAALFVGRARAVVNFPIVPAVAILISPPNAEAPASMLPRRPDPRCRYGVAYSRVLLAIADIDDERHVFRSIGKMPEVRVSALAFGAVPITATLSLQQPIRNGKIIPAVFDLPSPISVEKGQPLQNGQPPCDQAWHDDFPGPVFASGPIMAKVKDVAVDGHAVSVGEGCRTETTAQLQFNGNDPQHGGTFLTFLTGGTLYQRLDRRTTPTANPIRISPDSSNLVIPPFVGCRSSSGQDYSRLITSVVSGSQNTAAITAGGPAFPFDPQHPRRGGPFEAGAGVFATTDPPLLPAPGK